MPLEPCISYAIIEERRTGPVVEKPGKGNVGEARATLHDSLWIPQRGVMQRLVCGTGN